MTIDFNSEKFKLISRLIKESSLTLEESLIFLSEETEEPDNQEVINYVPFDDSVTCTSLDACSTWNSTFSYIRYDETLTI